MGKADQPCLPHSEKCGQECLGWEWWVQGKAVQWVPTPASLFNLGYQELNIRGFLLQRFWDTADKLSYPTGWKIEVSRIFLQDFWGRASAMVKKGKEQGNKGRNASRSAKPQLPFLAAASFLSFLNFSKARRMSTILLVSACFFLTSDKTPSAAALSSCSWGRKRAHENSCPAVRF